MTVQVEPVDPLDPHEAYALWAPTYPPNAHNPLMKAEERAMLSLLPGDMSGLRVLDAGCGSGRYLLNARTLGATERIGVDFSREMLVAARRDSGTSAPALVRGTVQALPIRDACADVTICALTVGHTPSLAASLAELRRATKPGGIVVCSDFHPDSAARGWRREFKVDGIRRAIRYWTHSLADWRQACRSVGLQIESVLEPHLDLADVPPGAAFDPDALRVPVVLALRLRRIDRR